MWLLRTTKFPHRGNSPSREGLAGNNSEGGANPYPHREMGSLLVWFSVKFLVYRRLLDHWKWTYWMDSCGCQVSGWCNSETTWWISIGTAPRTHGSSVGSETLIERRQENDLYLYRFTGSSNFSLFGLKSGPKQISKLMERMSGPGATGKNFMNPVRTLIYAWHVSAHQKDDSQETIFSYMADKLTRGELKRNFPKVRANYLLNLRTMESIQPRCQLF